MSSTQSSRYQGNPLLRILECYVLWSINQLSDSDARLMSDMTPRLRQLYQVEGTWQEVIETVMELPSAMPEMIRDLWDKNSALARAAGVDLTAQRFAEMFVDQNLAS